MTAEHEGIILQIKLDTELATKNCKPLQFELLPDRDEQSNSLVVSELRDRKAP